MVTDVCHEFSFLSRIIELSNCFFTRRVAEVTDFLRPEFSNYRINTFNHTENRGRSRIIGLSNFLHTECRGRSRIFFVPNFRIIELILSITRRIAEGHGFLSRDLSFGPTDQREVIIELFLHTLDNVYILGFSDVYKALRDKRLRSCRQPVFQNGDGRAGVCLSATKKTHGTKKIMLWECSFVSPALHHIMMVISLFQYKGIKIF